MVTSFGFLKVVIAIYVVRDQQRSYLHMYKVIGWILCFYY